jgi:hypothetical protein
MRWNLLLALCGALSASDALAQNRVGKFEIFETSLEASGSYSNPYREVVADATIMRPDNRVWRVPLFWNGGSEWRMRVSPDVLGRWGYRIESNDPRLNGKAGSFSCIESDRPGSIRASASYPGHFERQNGSPFWFLGDTGWAYFTDILDEKHDRSQAEAYVKHRAAQGFNVIHSMLLSEGGDGNRGGPPWHAITEEKINPGYFQEVDYRLAFANRNGLTVGIALAWGDKQKKEPFAWRRFPSVDARKRFARYVAARFGAYDTYFLISGEWHAEVRTRGDVSEDAVFREFVEIGSAFAANEPHGRMIGIHPMTGHGSVREFAAAPWMTFGDYQQNYSDLHGRTLLSRQLRGPVVNSEYGYFLRDQDGDGKPDKANSYTADDMRFSSWDIVMGGGYLVTGFGSTYFGGRRDPGAFDVSAAKNRVWEEQIGHIKKLFAGLDWWKLSPADELLRSASPRSADRTTGPSPEQRGRQLRPPETVYWALADPGQTYVAYVRGTVEPVTLALGARPRKFRVRQFNPRTGEFSSPAEIDIRGTYSFKAPDTGDTVLLLEAID